MDESSKKQMKVKQKDYLSLIDPPEAANLFGNDKSAIRSKNPHRESSEKHTQMKVKREDLLTVIKMSEKGHSKKAGRMSEKHNQKQVKVKQKDYLSLVDPPRAAQLWGDDKNAIKVKKGSNKEKQLKVKQSDFQVLMSMKETADHDNDGHRKKQSRKSTKEKGESSASSFGSLNQVAEKRIVFPDKASRLQNNRYESIPTKSYHSPREVSELVKKGHSSSTHQRRQGRRPLKEENPVDFGAMMHDRLRTWTPRVGESVKGKVPFMNGNSKSYDLLKEQTSLDNSMSHSSGSKDTARNSGKEIYISLEKKSIPEKNDHIRQLNPDICQDLVEIRDRNDNEIAVDSGSHHEYSKLNHDDQMLF
eukprot:Seg611.8 transcript_id=Seg611.8/GoldUCD/mRNA.D3Y31 product="hypothetical protein" protein_id=Seg611.8/GoldUCD/D3Y31